jgi:hydroxypyruvate isomerase
MKKLTKPSTGKANRSVPRRTFLKSATALAATASVGIPATGHSQESSFYKVSKGRIQQSVVHWCFNPMSVDELARNAAKLGMKSVELVGPEHFGTLKKHGLSCAISGSHGFAKGFAHKEEHEECLTKLRQSIDASAAAGFFSVITFSGFRRGLPTDVGMDNMVEGLKKIVGYAEKKKITLCLEMLNSRVDVTMKGHPDYFCDDIDRSVEICKRVGSERLKVLFDIYHVQIMHGDVITRIKQHHPYIGHYHTAGVPGRNEIDDTQEINYPPIMKVIAQTGYKGYVGQEFIPLRDKVQSLSQSVQICDV